ncbi:hypothetical protein AVEN_138955-1, partial [Araneus ventricosus]
LVLTFNARDLTSGVDIFKVTASTPTHLQLPWCSNNESHCRNLSFSLVLKSLDRTTEDGNTTFTVVTVVYKCLYIGDLDETYSSDSRHQDNLASRVPVADRQYMQCSSDWETRGVWTNRAVVLEDTDDKIQVRICHFF